MAKRKERVSSIDDLTQTEQPEEDQASLVAGHRAFQDEVTQLSQGNVAKRFHSMSTTIAKQFVCSISHELMVDPVLAEDGNTCVNLLRQHAPPAPPAPAFINK